MIKIKESWSIKPNKSNICVHTSNEFYLEKRNEHKVKGYQPIEPQNKLNNVVKQLGQIGTAVSQFACNHPHSMFLTISNIIKLIAQKLKINKVAD